MLFVVDDPSEGVLNYVTRHKNKVIPYSNQVQIRLNTPSTAQKFHPEGIKVKIRIWKNHFFIFYCGTPHSKTPYGMERVKLNLEFLFKASPTILYKFFTTPSCLIRWFCDEVDIQNNTFTFIWSGSEEVAFLVEEVEDELVRFQWEDAEDEEEFLEFRISKSPVTGETILEITDFCDEDEMDDQRQYWESQISLLRKETGG